MTSGHWLKYASIFLYCILAHWMLSGWELITAWIIVGACMAVVRIAPFSTLLCILMIAQTAIGLAYLLLLWRTDRHLSAIAGLSALSPTAWITLTIAVNLLTNLLCTAAAYHLARLFYPQPLYHWN